MNLKGKYTIITKDKSGNVISKKTKYNKITSVGKNIVLNLFKKASSNDNFKQMVGYKPLDLSTYYVTPLLRNPNYHQGVTQKYIDKIMLSSSETFYKTWFYYQSTKNHNYQDNVSGEKLQVKSSLFYDKNLNFDQVSQIYFPYLNITASIGDSTSGVADSKCVDYSQFDSHLTNGEVNNISKSNVDKVLNYNNNIDFIWSGCDAKCVSALTRNIHNIDFFLIRCIQKIQSNERNVWIPLWDGMTKEMQDQNIQLTQKKIKFKTSYQKITQNDTTVRFEKKKNIVVLYRIKTPNNINQWRKLSQSYFEIDEQSMQIKFTSDIFGNDVNQTDQFLVFYDVYYLDDRLQNGICGMYLNYSLTTDKQTKETKYLGKALSNNDGYYIKDGRMLFGNGVFSYDGFETLDDKVAFPWQGKPIKLQKTFNLDQNNYYQTIGDSGYNNIFFNNAQQYQSGSNHKLFTTSQYIDRVPERFYSFYPYVSPRPTNFVFMLRLLDNTISIKNFVFLVPQLRTVTPRVFIFGQGNNQEENPTEIIQDEIFRLDAIQCDASDENGIISWKTYIDYEIGNGYSITQLGLACGTDKLQPTSYGWKYIKPIKLQQCNELFSKIVLQEAVQKNQQQALEVIYELVVR